MLTTLHPGAPSADEVAALLTGVRILDDVIEQLTQLRIELDRLIADSHWESRAVRMLRASLTERHGQLAPLRAEVEAQRDGCLRAVV